MGLNTNQSNVPLISNVAQLSSMMQVWRNAVGRLVKNAAPAPAPQNFLAQAVPGGVQISWGTSQPISPSKVLGQATARTAPDGYILLASRSGDFVNDVESYSLKNINQTTFFYPTSQPTSVSFRIQATSGTADKPQSITGTLSGAVRNVSLAPTAPKAGAIVRDNATSDQTRATTRFGSYVSGSPRQTYGERQPTL